MAASAKLSMLRSTPRTTRLVVDLIRGKHVEEARRVLRLTSYGPNDQVAKILNSAVSNAEQVPGVVPENLFVVRAWVDEGPTLRRFRPRALGRATRINKRTSHITVVVGTTEEVPDGAED